MDGVECGKWGDGGRSLGGVEAMGGADEDVVGVRRQKMGGEG